MQRKNIVLTAISSLALAAAGSLPVAAADDSVPTELVANPTTQTRESVLQAGSLSQATRNLEPTAATTEYSIDDVVRAGSLSALIDRAQPGPASAFEVALLNAQALVGIPVDVIVRTGSLSQALRNTVSVAEPGHLARTDQQ